MGEKTKTYRSPRSPILKGKVGKASEAWLRKTLSAIGSEAKAPAHLKRAEARFRGGLSGLKALAPPVVPPTISGLAETASAFSPGAGDLGDVVSLASLTEDLMRGKKKLDKKTLASFALGLAGVIIPGGSGGHATREEIVKHLHKQAERDLSDSKAMDFAVGINSILERIPQKKLDEIQRMSNVFLEKQTRGQLQRELPYGTPLESFHKVELMKKTKPQHVIFLSRDPDIWGEQSYNIIDAVQSVSAHEIGHSVLYRAIEQGSKKAALVQRKENILSDKISKLKTIEKKPTKYSPEKKDYERKIRKLSQVEYKHSFQEAFANNFSRNIRETELPYSEAEVAKNYQIVFDQSLDETLSRSSNQLNRELRQDYKALFNK